MTHRHHASIHWARQGARFTDHRYSRAHRWRFDGGAELPASSSPLVVRVPFSDPAGVDPEEAFVAALASCHMLWFLDLAARAGFVVDRYDDAAVGCMGRTPEGREWVERVELQPAVVFAPQGRSPDDAAVEALHHAAHEACYIANSVRSEVLTRGSWSLAPA
jgi:organic hydroperoxide reductase OsmC/OhrA